MSEENQTEEIQEEKPTTAVQTFMNEIDNPLVPYGAREAIKELTRRIMMTDNGKIKKTLAEAFQVAQVAIATRASLFDGELFSWVSINKKGERKLTTFHGRRYISRIGDEWAQENETTLTDWYELISSHDEKRELNIPETALAYRAYVRNDARMEVYTKGIVDLVDAGYKKEEAEELLGQPPIHEGIGVVTKEEMETLDSSYGAKMPHANRAQKRALVEAMKRAIAFRKPPVSTLPLDGFVKLDWTPKSLQPSSQIVDSEFVDVDNGEEEEQTFTDVKVEIVDKALEDIEAEVKKDHDQIEVDAKHAEDTNRVNRRSKKDMAERRKVGWWKVKLLDNIIAKTGARNRTQVAGVLAYCPEHKPKMELADYLSKWYQYFMEERNSGKMVSSWQCADAAWNRWLDEDA